MNRWIRNTLLASSLVGALALVPGAVAFASDAAHADAGDHAHRGKGGGLLGAALKLDSLTADQRAAIETLVQQRRTAGTPVRAADAQFLTVLAQQVERAKIEPQGLAASLAAERGALNQLHALLTPAQRGQLVDRIAQGRGDHAGHEHGKGAGREGGRGRWIARALDLTPGQEAEIRANLQAQGGASTAAPHAEHGDRGKLLDAFRADTFDATAFVHARDRGEGIEKLAAAAVPVLTPAQRATLADHLRKRAAHEAA